MYRKAHAIDALSWVNSPAPLTLNQFKGKVVLIEAFQMLCPGCVAHGLPQAMRVRQTFSEDDVIVLGLHSVFEHHDAQGSQEALDAFLHEYKITFPVAIDRPATHGGVPATMAKYGLQGTPTTILIDRQGHLRKQKFGMEQDMVLGAEIMSLVLEGRSQGVSTQDEDRAGQKGCDEHQCAIS